MTQGKSTRRRRRGKLKLNFWVHPTTGQQRVYLTGSGRDQNRIYAFATERGGFSVSSSTGSNKDISAALTALATLGIGTATPFAKLLEMATAGRAPVRKKPARKTEPERLEGWQQQHLASIRNEI